MIRILRDEYGRIVAIYIDDLIVFGPTWAECWKRTLLVLRKIKDAGLVVNIGKASLC